MRHCRSAAHRPERKAGCSQILAVSHFYGLIDLVGSYPQLAFLAVLLLALSEAIPVIGTVVPGSTLILAISALATAADVKPWILLLAAMVGAIAGDGLSFWLGYRYRREILTRLALEPVSSARCAQRTIHTQVWRPKRIPCPIHGGGAGLCTIGRRNPANVVTPLLRGQCAVRTDMGADPCLSRRPRGHSPECRRPERHQAWSARARRPCARLDRLAAAEKSLVPPG